MGSNKMRRSGAAPAKAPEHQQQRGGGIDYVIEAIQRPSMREQMARQLPRHLSLERFLRIAVTMLRDRSDLADAEPISIIASIMEASALGFELDPLLGHCYLLAFRNSKTGKKQCIPVPGYRGFIHLMRQSGKVTHVTAGIVVEGDEFEVREGTERQLIHRPDLRKGSQSRLDEKKWLGAYAVVHYADGTTDFEYMPREEVLAHRDRSPAAKGERPSGPWFGDALDKKGMWLKTPIRGIAKRSPLSATIVELAVRDEMREIPSLRDDLVPRLPSSSEPIDAEVVDEQPKLPDVEGPIGQSVIDTLLSLADRRGLSDAHVTAACKQHGYSSLKEVKRSDVGKIMDTLSSWEAPKERKTKDEAPSASQPVPESMITALTNLAKQQGVSDEQLIEIVGSHGFERLDEITKAAYEKIWSDLVMRRPQQKLL